MNKLFFATASKGDPISVPRSFSRKLRHKSWIPFDEVPDEWAPYDNFKSTVLSSICAATKIGISPRYDAAPVWGLHPSLVEGNRNIEEGDLLIFYAGSNSYPFAGRVHTTDRNEELAKDLWPFYEIAEKRGDMEDEPWSYILYLDTVWHVSIPEDTLDRLIKPMGGPEDRVIRGFRRVRGDDKLPVSPLEAVKRWSRNTRAGNDNTGSERDQSVSSVAIDLSDRDGPFSNPVADEPDDDKLLSKALVADDLEIDYLTSNARQRALSCLQDCYQ